MTTVIPKNTPNLHQKVNQRQNTVCLEQQIYASPKNFTPTLLVMLETFKRSDQRGLPRLVLNALKPKQ